MTYPATPYLRRLTADNGWHGELILDHHGQPNVLVTVRVGPVWTDSVVIAGEDRVIAMRHHTHHDSPLVIPTELRSGRSAAWCCDGRAEDVLAELFELPGDGGRQ